MSKGKQARLMSQLGNNMAESAGVKLSSEDRFAGFIPSESASGEMALDRIMEDAEQPRKTYDEQALLDFAEHLKTHGVQQPIQLRWSDADRKWLIVFGHRRFRAAQIAGFTSIPCIFADGDIDETTIRVRQLVENCQREDLAPLEMARAIKSLCSATGWSNRRIAEELGYKHPTIGRYLDLLKLPDELQAKVDDGELAPSVAIDVLRIAHPADQTKIGNDIASRKLTRRQAKGVVDQQINGRASDAEMRRPTEKELLLQNGDIAVYRNPHVPDIRIQKALLAVAAQLEPEKAEA